MTEHILFFTLYFLPFDLFTIQKTTAAHFRAAVNVIRSYTVLRHLHEFARRLVVDGDDVHTRSQVRYV